MVDNLEGRLIVIDGSDGSGKTEQTNRLIARLEEAGYPVKTISFPRYGNSAAADVERYLNGEFGPKEGIDPKSVAKFFAKDRADFAPVLNCWLNEGYTVVSNRYTTSNVGHQSIRYPTWNERDEFIKWLFDYEYGELGIPKPDATIICHVPYEIALSNIMLKDSGRQDRSYLHGQKVDIHEADKNHLMNAIAAYQRYANMLPGWHLVECARAGKMKSYESIHSMIWELVEPIFLPGFDNGLSELNDALGG